MAASADTTSRLLPFEINRVFNASLQRVWKAWSDAEQLQHWWGPKGCSIEVPLLEFRPGGFCHFAMKFAGEGTTWGRFNYREIVPRERIVWLNSFSNESCGITRAPFSELCPLEIENHVTFREHAGATTVVLRARPFGATPEECQYFEEIRSSLEEGYGGTLEQLTSYLART
jgi:uncharacterized protein YndB with AHSA1/START domain